MCYFVLTTKVNKKYGKGKMKNKKIRTTFREKLFFNYLYSIIVRVPRPDLQVFVTPWNNHFLPKSAGISPHLSVGHLIIGLTYLFSLNHFSARSII